jgi:hypothetical protein
VFRCLGVINLKKKIKICQKKIKIQKVVCVLCSCTIYRLSLDVAHKKENMFTTAQGCPEKIEWFPI